MNFISRIIKSINAMRERWYYYCYIMCDKLRKEAKTMLMLEDDRRY